MRYKRIPIESSQHQKKIRGQPNLRNLCHASTLLTKRLFHSMLAIPGRHVALVFEEVVIVVFVHIVLHLAGAWTTPDRWWIPPLTQAVVKTYKARHCKKARRVVKE